MKFVCGDRDDPVTNILKKYKDHPRVFAVKNNLQQKSHFPTVEGGKYYRKIKFCKRGKRAVYINKHLKENADLFADYVLRAFNENTNRKFSSDITEYESNLCPFNSRCPFKLCEKSILST